jgi:hypothetical protein
VLLRACPRRRPSPARVLVDRESTSVASGVQFELTRFFCRTCSACGKNMQGAFVRALGTVFHLNCFKCMVHPSSGTLIGLNDTDLLFMIGLWYGGSIQILSY